MNKKSHVQKPKKSGVSFSLAPKDEALLEDYYKNNLLVPGKINEDKADFTPLDFTSLSSREIGRQQSSWSVRHSYLLYLLGNLEAEKGNLKADLKDAEGDWMVKHLGEYKYKWEAEHAMNRNKRIKKLRSRLTRVEASLSRYGRLSESYAAIQTAASREISRRLGERPSRD